MLAANINTDTYCNWYTVLLELAILTQPITKDSFGR